MRIAGPELTDDQVAEYRKKLADPEYMEHAMYCMADRLYRDLTRDDGSDEAKFHRTGKKGYIAEE